MGACDGLQQPGCAGAAAEVAEGACGRVFAVALHEGWAQGVGPVLHPCWRADCAASGEERPGNSSGHLHAHAVFTAAAAELSASLLGWVGGSPVADDNPCMSTWLHPIMAYKTPVSLFFLFFWTIPDCFSCSKGETDPAVGVACTSGPCPSSSATDIQSEVSDEPCGVTHAPHPSLLPLLGACPPPAG